MSRKHKPQKRRKQFPWMLLVLGGVFVAIAVFLFGRQNSNGGTPSIAVDQQRIDYGDVKFGVNKTFAIKVTNTGNGALRFKEDPYIEVVEGC